MRLSLLAQYCIASRDRLVIEVIYTLLVLMKKYGKALAQPIFRDQLTSLFPDAMKLYVLAGSHRFDVKKCQYLLASVSAGLSYNHLDIESFSPVSIPLLDGDQADYTLCSDIGLYVQGKGKIYKRTLHGDLLTLSQ